MKPSTETIVPIDWSRIIGYIFGETMFCLPEDPFVKSMHMGTSNVTVRPVTQEELYNWISQRT